MDFEAEVLNQATTYDSDEERDDPESSLPSQSINESSSELAVTVDEDEEESPVPIEMQLHGQSPKGRVLKRRMSAMFVMKFDRNVDALDAETSEKIHDLLARFPFPPDHMNFQQAERVSITKEISSSATKVVASTWGSIRSGIASWTGVGKSSSSKK